MKNRTKRIVALLLAFVIILQQDGMAGVTADRLVSADEILPTESQDAEIVEELPADTAAEIISEDDPAEAADSGTGISAESPADSGASAATEDSAEPQITVTEIEVVEQEETPSSEEESVLSTLKLDNSAQAAADAQVCPVNLELTRPGGFPADAIWNLEVIEEEELASLTAETAMNPAGGLALRFSVESDGNACHLTGTTAVLDGLDVSFLTGAHLSLCRGVNGSGASAESDGSDMSGADKWEKLAVQFSENDGAVRASFSVDSDGVLFFWKDAEAEADEAEADGESTETETGADTAVETESETETETETENDELVDDLDTIGSYDLMQIDADGTDEIEYPVYEILYADGEMVFQTDDILAEGKTAGDVIKIFHDDGSTHISGDATTWEFNDLRQMITTVTFREDVPMQSLECIFKGCTELQEVNIGGFTATGVTRMGSAFYDCKKLHSLDLSKWNTSSVTYMSFMFRGCSGLTELDVSTWNTSSVTQFQQTFRDCSKLKSLNVSRWDTSSADNLQQVFYGCGALTALDLSNWDANKASSLNQLFNHCDALSQLTLGPNFKFKGDTSLKGTWIRKTTKKSYSVKDFEEQYNAEMADIYYKLTPIYFHANDGTNNKSTLENGYIGKTLEDTDVTTPVRAGCEFAGWWPKPNSEEGGQLKVGDTITQTDYYAHWKEYKVYEIFYKGTGKLVFQDTDEVDSTEVDPEETDKYEIYEDDGSKASGNGASNASWEFHGIRSQIKSVVFRDNVKLKTLQFIFNGCDQLLTVDTQKYDASGVTSIAQAFNGCASLTDLDLSNWDASSVENMGYLGKRQIMRLQIKRTPLISDVQVCGIFPGAAPTTEAGHPVQTDQARPFAYIFLLIP